MDDLDLDRELRHALQATPSPEFVARVRVSIAEAARPSIFAGVLKPMLALACAAVLAIAVGIWRQDARLKPSPTKIQARPAQIVGSPTEMAPATADVKVRTTSETDVTNGPHATKVQPKVVRVEAPARVALAKVATSAKEEPLPEVIISPEDAEAFRQFLTSAYDRRFVASFEDTPASDSWVMNDLTVPPITVAPLDPPPAYNN